jgi:hypothetical protein
MLCLSIEGDMRRREFLGFLGAAAAASPLAAQAQQVERTRRIGVLNGLAANDPQGQANNAAFLQSLQQLGWAEGRNTRIDYRWGAGNADEMRRYAAELVTLAPDVLVATGGASVGPLLRRPERFRSCSQMSPIRLAPGLSKVFRVRVATLPDLCSSNTI